jgi:hypothetical protein
MTTIAVVVAAVEEVAAVVTAGVPTRRLSRLPGCSSVFGLALIGVYATLRRRAVVEG